MPKSKTPNYIKDMRKEGQAPKPSKKALPEKRSLHSQIFSLLGYLAVIVGLIQFIFWLAPDISVVPETPVSENPFSTPFIIENSGRLSISNVQASCLISHQIFQNNVNQTNDSSVAYMEPIGHLRHGDRRSLTCHNPVEFNMSPISADATLTVTYNPPFTWFQRKLRFRFQTVKQSDGMLRWEP